MLRMLWNMMRHPTGYNCLHTRKLLLDYAEGLLQAPVQTKLERHLSDCEDCQALVSSYREVIEVAGREAALDLPLPAELEQKLIEFMRSNL